MARKCEHAANRESPLPRVMGASKIACVLWAFQSFAKVFKNICNS